MFPCSTANDFTNGLIAFTPRVSYLCHSSTVFVIRPHFDHITRRENRTCIAFSNWRVEAILGFAISDIIKPGSKKQMGWITAARVVALVAHLKTAWNFADHQSPHNPVRALSSRGTHATISTGGDRPRPLPTSTTRLHRNQIKKSLYEKSLLLLLRVFNEISHHVIDIHT